MREWLSIRNMRIKCEIFSCSVKPMSANCISCRMKNATCWLSMRLRN
uniref:Alternative protein SLK n=1 Tax=Homo sapiens TaxID=9606 RepID=L8ECF1_HUMAN|nr:alternative protein SLK [Homo sapiens]